MTSGIILLEISAVLRLILMSLQENTPLKFMGQIVQVYGRMSQKKYRFQ